MNCGICEADDAKLFVTGGGLPIGYCCFEATCSRLMWNQHLNARFGATAEEKAMLVWSIAQAKRNKKSLSVDKPENEP